MLKKLCKCGVSIPITQKQCDKCRGEYQREYDLYKRTNKDFYNSKAWRQLRLVCKQKFSGIDVYHYYKTGRIKSGSLPHHIVEVEEDINKSLDLNNLIWVSDASHKEIHARYEKNIVKTQNELMQMIRNWVDKGEVKKV